MVCIEECLKLDGFDVPMRVRKLLRVNCEAAQAAKPRRLRNRKRAFGP